MYIILKTRFDFVGTLHHQYYYTYIVYSIHTLQMNINNITLHCQVFINNNIQRTFGIFEIKK